jgi:hypothetical protein
MWAGGLDCFVGTLGGFCPGRVAFCDPLHPWLLQRVMMWV